MIAQTIAIAAGGAVGAVVRPLVERPAHQVDVVGVTVGELDVLPVDAGAGRCGQHIMPLCLQQFDQFSADKTGAANEFDFLDASGVGVISALTLHLRTANIGRIDDYPLFPA